MYEIYSTKAFILKSKDNKENNKIFLIFSQDFGLIWITGIGIKKEKSKLKSIFQIFSFLKILLVKGKTGYRIVGGEEIENFFFQKTNHKRKKVEIIKKNILLLETLLVKNHPEQKFFTLFIHFIYDIFQEEKIKNIKKTEIFFLINFLQYFGYFDQKWLDFIKEKKETITSKEINLVIKEINKQIKKISF